MPKFRLCLKKFITATENSRAGCPDIRRRIQNRCLRGAGTGISLPRSKSLTKDSTNFLLTYSLVFLDLNTHSPLSFGWLPVSVVIRQRSCLCCRGAFENCPFFFWQCYSE